MVWVIEKKRNRQICKIHIKSYSQNQPPQDITSKLEDTLNQFKNLSIANQKNIVTSIKKTETQVGTIAKQLAKQ